MRCFLCCIIAGLAAAPSAEAANTWCSTNFPSAVFCDDFDRYCEDPPPEPAACTGDEYVDGGLFYSRWTPTGPCSSPLALDGAHAASPPWAVKTNTQENSTLALARRSIADSVRAKFGESYSSVIGTDLNPLVLELVMHANRPRYDNSYLSLGTGFAVAPTEYAWSGFCGCSSADPRYPIVCAQESPAAACPPQNTWPHVSCLAVGFVAYLDSDPCHCSESIHSPANDHLAFYDGFKWYRLRQGLFPAGSGDFRVRGGQHHWIKVVVRSSTFRVELVVPGTGESSWCELPREYTGAFSSMTVGYAIPCQLKTGNWECRGDSNDPACGDGAPNGSVPYYDNIVLHGGAPYEPQGACCYADTTCEDARWSGDCQSLGGTFAGSGSTCGTIACCPPLLPDHDMDTDVDLEDFGWFQTCLSSAPFALPPTLACTCADLDSDGDVDAGDFELFQNCLYGAGITPPAGCAE